MMFGKSERERPRAYTRLALVLLVCGLVLGGLWALTLIGLVIGVLTRIVL
jgi:hypothetical protein